MHRRTSTAIALCLLTLAVHAADTPLALEPGHWRMHTVATATTPPPHGAPRPTPLVYDSDECITADDIRAGRLFEADDGCTLTVLQAAASDWTVRETCATGDGSRVTDYAVHLRSRRALTAHATAIERAGTVTRAGTLDVTGDWLSAACDQPPTPDAD